MSKAQNFSKNEKITFDDVLAIIDNVCEDKIRSIISAADGNIHELARKLYTNKFGDVVFYPWSHKPFNEYDPESYCTGLEIEATFYFNSDEIENLKLNGTRFVTIWLLENGTVQKIRIDGGEFWHDGQSDKTIYINRLKEHYETNPELFEASEFFEADNQKGV